jgi:hypothetical protein
MARRFSILLGSIILLLVCWAGWSEPAQAQNYTPLDRYFYYPYYYFPHSYWPNMAPRWPDPSSKIQTRPPAFMAYPPFREPHWRYEYFEPQFYHRGSHFWLDQF